MTHGQNYPILTRGFNMGARVSLLIEYIPSGQGRINYGELATRLKDKGNNISNPQVMNTQNAGGIKPFILGLSKLGSEIQGGDGHYFFGGKAHGLWTKQKSGGSKDFTPVIEITIPGNNINFFIIRFDEGNKEWATRLEIDNVDYINNSPMFFWQGTAANSHTIKIKEWNKSNRQLKITSILVGMIGEYDRKYFQQGGRIIAGSRQTTDNTKPNYGVAAQYGSFQAIDVDGSFDKMSQSELLTDGLRSGIFINAEPYAGQSYDDYKAANKSKMLGDYRLAEVNFIGDNVSAELTDDILSWGAVYQQGIENNASNTGYTFFTRLQAVTPHTVNISGELIYYLQKFLLPDGFIPPSMLDVAWDIFCWATGTHISKSMGGDIWLTR